jgi:hypothetical protein
VVEIGATMMLLTEYGEEDVEEALEEVEEEVVECRRRPVSSW